MGPESGVEAGAAGIAGAGDLADAEESEQTLLGSGKVATGAEAEGKDRKRKKTLPNLLNASGFNQLKQGFLNRVFPPGKKEQGIRRYAMFMLLLFVVDAFVWGVFSGVYITSVAPVVALNDGVSFTEARCTCTAYTLQHDVSVGFVSSFRGEITAFYNDTTSGRLRYVQIHDTVTGIYGSLGWATNFLDRFSIGGDFECFINKSQRYYAAIKPEGVMGSIVFLLVVLGLMGVTIFYALLRTFGSYIKFRREYEWDEKQEVWIVKTTPR